MKQGETKRLYYENDLKIPTLAASEVACSISHEHIITWQN